MAAIACFEKQGRGAGGTLVDGRAGAGGAARVAAGVVREMVAGLAGEAGGL